MNELDRIYASLGQGEREGRSKKAQAALHERAQELREAGVEPEEGPKCYSCFSPVTQFGQLCPRCFRLTYGKDP